MLSSAVASSDRTAQIIADNEISLQLYCYIFHKIDNEHSLCTDSEFLIYRLRSRAIRLTPFVEDAETEANTVENRCDRQYEGRYVGFRVGLGMIQN
jgi:hypothetical protein